MPGQDDEMDGGLAAATATNSNDSPIQELPPEKPVFVYKSSYITVDRSKVYQFKIERGSDANDHRITSIRPIDYNYWYLIKNKKSVKLQKHPSLVQTVIKNEVPKIPKLGRVIDIYLSINYLKAYYNQTVGRHIFDGYILIDEKEELKNCADRFKIQLLGRAKSSKTKQLKKEEKLKNAITLTRDSDDEDPDLSDSFDYSKYLKEDKFKEKRTFRQPRPKDQNQRQSSNSQNVNSNTQNTQKKTGLQNKDDYILPDYVTESEEDDPTDSFHMINNSLFDEKSKKFDLKNPSISAPIEDNNQVSSSNKTVKKPLSYVTPQHAKAEFIISPASTGQKRLRNLVGGADGNLGSAEKMTKTNLSSNVTEEFLKNFNLDDTVNNVQ